jgi:hypothetical protein
VSREKLPGTRSSFINPNRRPKTMKYTTKIVPDQDAENPMTACDNPGIYVVTHHRNYVLGTKEDSFNKLEDAHSRIEDLKAAGAKFAYPLYMYDHSGITISLSPFSCRWDSGQVGMVIINPVEFGNPDLTDEQAKEVAESMVKELDLFLQGECYGYIIEDEAGETVDSCFGYLGRENSEEAAETFASIMK